MFNWCKVVKLVLQAEFPDFELLAKFSVFRLVGHADEAATTESAPEDRKPFLGAEFGPARALNLVRTELT